MKDLKDIIEKLRAPKDLYNKFGQYKYRSCESILEAVKPLLAERGCLLNLSDCVVCIGGANYVRAEATFISSTGEKMNADGWAREDMDKKGMDAPQMTGTASSYARKYALNGFFAKLVKISVFKRMPKILCLFQIVGPKMSSYCFLAVFAVSTTFP